jgi:hypothetical protein
MKTRATVATLIVAAAASADARLASPFPRKAVAPEDSGHWMVINGSPWSHEVKFNMPRLPMDKLAEARRVRPVAERTDEKSPPIREKFLSSAKRFHILLNADLRMLEINNMRTVSWFGTLSPFVSAVVAPTTAAAVPRRSGSSPATDLAQAFGTFAK